jgi:hypothetical protein
MKTATQTAGGNKTINNSISRWISSKAKAKMNDISKESTKIAK